MVGALGLDPEGPEGPQGPSAEPEVGPMAYSAYPMRSVNSWLVDSVMLELFDVAVVNDQNS